MKAFATVGNKNRFVITGAGETARLHAMNIQRIGKLVAVCGEDEAEREAFARAYDVKAYGSFDEMLQKEQEFEIVVVCSPVGYHAEHIIKSLQAGKDVLCESPLCLTKAAAWQIIETEKYCRKRVFLIERSRFSSSFSDFKKQFDEHRYSGFYSFNLNAIAGIGDRFFSSSSGKVFPDGGLLYQPFFTTLIEFLLWFFGEVKGIETFVYKPFSAEKDEIERSGASILKMQNGTTGALHWSATESVLEYNPRLTIVSHGRFAESEFSGNELLLHTNNPVTAKATEAFADDLYKRIYVHLLKALRNNENKLCGTLHGAKTVETIENIYKAVR